MSDDIEKQIAARLQQSVEAQTVSDYATALALARQAVALAQAAGLQEAEARGNFEWARALLFQGDFLAATAQFEQTLALARVAGQRRIEADALRGMGLACSYQSLHAEAERHLLQALHIYREIGDRQGEGRTCNTLGENYTAQADWGQAQIYGERALQLCREAGDRQGLCWALGNLGEIYRARGDYYGARRYYEQSLALDRELGDRRGQGITLSNLSLVAHNLGDRQAAWEYAQQAAACAETAGDRRLSGMVAEISGHALAGLERWDEAARAYQESLAIKNEIGELNHAMEPLAGLAQVALARGDTAGARRYVEEILAYLAFEGALDGVDEPFRVQLTCYQVLRAAADPRAPATLAHIARLLQTQAARIPDATMRRAFLEDVPYHREIMALFHQQLTATGD